jgi:hypothetical protein
MKLTRKTFKVTAVTLLLTTATAFTIFYFLKISRENNSLTDSLLIRNRLIEANARLLTEDAESVILDIERNVDDTLANRWVAIARTFLSKKTSQKQEDDSMKAVAFELSAHLRNKQTVVSRLREETRLRENENDSLSGAILHLLEENATLYTRFEELHNEITGLKSAFGTVTFERDSAFVKYIGEMKDGMPHGDGIGVFNGRGIYDGKWHDGVRHGHGKYTWANGDVYEGDFNDGKRNGNGIYFFTSGERYHGEWKDDLRNGQGAMIAGNDTILGGFWVQDKFKKTLRTSLE